MDIQREWSTDHHAVPPAQTCEAKQTPSSQKPERRGRERQSNKSLYMPILTGKDGGGEGSCFLCNYSWHQEEKDKIKCQISP